MAAPLVKPAAPAYKSLLVTPTPAPVFPFNFDECKMANTPAEPNICFDYVVKAPKQFVFEAWNLTADNEGGMVTPVTQGTPVSPPWAGVANNMERLRGERNAPLCVNELIGNVCNPEQGDWHMEWKTGEPYAPLPCLVRFCCMASLHGSASLVDGPGENETTVQVRNRVNLSGCCPTSVTMKVTDHTLQSITKPAEERFKEGKFVGPESMGR